MILTRKADFEKFVSEVLSRKPNEIKIATYGFNNLPEFQKTIGTHNKLKLLIGLSPLRECVKNCINCRILHNIRMSKYKQIPHLYKGQVAFKSSMHTKIYLFKFRSGESVAILGSRNLVGSNWSEICTTIENPEDIDEIEKEFDMLWGYKQDSIDEEDIIDYEEVLKGIKKYKKSNDFLDSVYNFYKKTGMITDKQIAGCIKVIESIKGEVDYDYHNTVHIGVDIESF